MRTGRRRPRRTPRVRSSSGESAEVTSIRDVSSPTSGRSTCSSRIATAVPAAPGGRSPSYAASYQRPSTYTAKQPAAVVGTGQLGDREVLGQQVEQDLALDRADDPAVEGHQAQTVDGVDHAHHARLGRPPAQLPHAEAGGDPVVPVGDAVDGTGTELPQSTALLAASAGSRHTPAAPLPAFRAAELQVRLSVQSLGQGGLDDRSVPVQQRDQLGALGGRGEQVDEGLDPFGLDLLVPAHPAVEERLDQHVGHETDVELLAAPQAVDVEPGRRVVVPVRARRHAGTHRDPDREVRSDAGRASSIGNTLPVAWSGRTSRARSGRTISTDSAAVIPCLRTRSSRPRARAGTSRTCPRSSGVSEPATSIEAIAASPPRNTRFSMCSTFSPATLSRSRTCASTPGWSR